MTYLSIILLCMLGFAVAETMCWQWPNVCRQLSRIQWGVLLVLVVSKYALGPDVSTYLPMYRTCPSVQEMIQHPWSGEWESGWMWMCSICSSIGMSYWMMTAVIALLYMGAVGCWLRKVEWAPCMSLFLLALLDYNLMLYEMRQCVAVSCYLYALLAWHKGGRWYGLAALLAVVCVMMHKSGVFMIGLTALLYGGWQLKLDKRHYAILLLALVVLAGVPTLAVVTPAVAWLPERVARSIQMHLDVRQWLQTIGPIYGLGILVVGYYVQPEEGDRRWHWLMWCALAMIVVLYPYWWLLNRLRSYFIWPLIVYVMGVMYRAKIKDRLPRQVWVVVLYMYTGLFIYTNIYTPIKSETNRVSVVWERRQYTQEELENRQIERALDYWEKDYHYMQEKGARR